MCKERIIHTHRDILSQDELSYNTTDHSAMVEWKLVINPVKVEVYAKDIWEPTIGSRTKMYIRDQQQVLELNHKKCLNWKSDWSTEWKKPDCHWNKWHTHDCQGKYYTDNQLNI